jgi:hypothetical protein
VRRMRVSWTSTAPVPWEDEPAAVSRIEPNNTVRRSAPTKLKEKKTNEDSLVFSSFVLLMARRP